MVRVMVMGKIDCCVFWEGDLSFVKKIDGWSHHGVKRGEL